jgi:hypothetical protein
MDMRTRRPLHTDRSLAASFHGQCDGQAIAIVLPGGQSKQSFMGGGSPSVTCDSINSFKTKLDEFLACRGFI